MNLLEALSPERLSEKNQEQCCSAKEVVITEKTDGSSFRLMIAFNQDGQSVIQAGSHHQKLNNEALPNTVHGNMTRLLLQDQTKIQSIFNYLMYLTGGPTSVAGTGLTFWGELYGPGIQATGRKYAKDVHWAIFDIAIQHQGQDVRLLDWDAMTKLCERLSLEYVPAYYRGGPDMMAFYELLKEPSLVAQQNGMPELKPMEGLVIKENPPRIINGLDWVQKWNVYKLKNESFEEVRKPKIKREGKDLSAAKECAERLVTPERIRHVVEQLKEQGIDLCGDIADMKYLCRSLYTDVIKEEKDIYESYLSETIKENDLNKALNEILKREYLQMSKA